MPIQQITSRFNGRVLYEREADSLLTALRIAVKSGAYLRGADLCDADLRGADLRDADLRDADLRGADLRDADLCDADLRGADLRGADLRDADLCDADLRGAYLRGADLRGAYLRGAYLRGAYLRGAYLNWQSHDVIAEILRRAAGDDLGKRKIAGLILVSRDWCWRKFAAMSEDPLWSWAMDILAEYVIDDDGSPQCVRDRVKREQK